MAMGDFYPHTSLKIDGNTLISSENPWLQISGFIKPVRSIALLEIPVLELHLDFAGSLSAFECQEAIGRFDLYTRRGGG
jgi:hypothetical protein